MTVCGNILYTVCFFNFRASASINILRLICSWTCVLLFKPLVSFIMNKVLRDSETQLKGTTLFCNLFVICAFQPNHFEPRRSPKLKKYCLHLYPEKQEQNGGIVLFFFCAISRHHVWNKAYRQSSLLKPVLVKLSFFSLWFPKSQLSWLAPSTCCGHCSMWLLTYHVMQERR